MPDSSGGAGAGKFVKPDGSGNDLPQPDATVNSQTIKQTDAEGKTAIACEGNNCKCYICGCLAGGTPIALDNSNEHPNHEIKVGDFVMGYDHYKKDTIASRVVRLVRSNAGKINRLFIQGKSLDITDGHPVFVPSVDKYIPADSLRRGMKLLALSGALLTIDSVQTVQANVPTYDFEVAGVHNYFAGEMRVLVHNNNNNNACNTRMRKAGFSDAQIQAVQDAFDAHGLNLSQRLDFLNDIQGNSNFADYIKTLGANEMLQKVQTWNRILECQDLGIQGLRTNIPSLQKFENILANNNLGLNAQSLNDLLNAAHTKGLSWDEPNNILDAIIRASDANIGSLSISHKKFPESTTGTSFVLSNAKQFQREASGDANLSFDLNGTSFDDIAPDGKLIDRKYGHSSSIFDKTNDGLE